jgi:DNA-directed RNA polymerase I subunit RPA1
MWERQYAITLKTQPEERIREAFGLGLEDIAGEVAKKFLARLGYLMKMQLNRAKLHDGETGDVIVNIPKGGGVGMVGGDDDETGGDADENDSAPNTPTKKTKAKAVADDDDEYDDEVAGEEDGVMGSRFGHKKEQGGYGEDDDDDKELQQQDKLEKMFDEDSSDEEESEEKKSEEVMSPRKERQEKQVDESVGMAGDGLKLNKKTYEMVLPPIRVDVSTRPLLLTDLCEAAAAYVVVRQRPAITRAAVIDGEKNERLLQTEGCNFEELFEMSESLVNHNKISSNDIWAIRCTYGVEAAAASIGQQITSVFGVYGIEVDPRHLSLISDYMTFNGEYKPMNRRGMVDGSSAFLQMSFETSFFENQFTLFQVLSVGHSSMHLPDPSHDTMFHRNTSFTAPL